MHVMQDVRSKVVSREARLTKGRGLAKANGRAKTIVIPFRRRRKQIYALFYSVKVASGTCIWQARTDTHHCGVMIEIVPSRESDSHEGERYSGNCPVYRTVASTAVRILYRGTN